MATFETQIDALTGIGTGNTTIQGYMDDWLTSGARQVIDILPMSKLKRMSEEVEFHSGNTVLEGDNQDGTGAEDLKVLHILRLEETSSPEIYHPCREISPEQKGRAIDSNYMEFATSTDPVYYISNKEVYVLPAKEATNASDNKDCKLIKINEDFTVSYNDNSISNFPKEANTAVMLYASRNALEYLINSKNEDEDTELVSSYRSQYELIDAQYKEALQMLSLDISEQEPGKK